MSHTPVTLASAAPTPSNVPVLDVERLDCFHVAVAFHGLVPQLASRAGHRLRDQLERASASITLNLSEGVGRRAPRDKAHFFAIARGSAAECAAILYLLLSRGLVDEREAVRARVLLVRVIAMLTKLEQRFLGRR